MLPGVNLPICRTVQASGAPKNPYIFGAISGTCQSSATTLSGTLYTYSVIEFKQSIILCRLGMTAVESQMIQTYIYERPDQQY